MPDAGAGAGLGFLLPSSRCPLPAGALYSRKPDASGFVWAVQLINRVRPTGFFRSRYFVSVHAFFCNRLESIPRIRIYSAKTRFQVEVTEKKNLHIKFFRFGVETQKNRPDPTDVKFHPQPKSFEIPPMECS